MISMFGKTVKKKYILGGTMRHIAAIFVKNLRGKMTVGTFPPF